MIGNITGVDIVIFAIFKNIFNTVCDVFINGKFVASSDNCFIKFEFDVKDFLVDGENELLIYFHSPVNWVKDKYKACMTPMNSNGQNGIVHIRKPQCHFGWTGSPRYNTHPR